VAQRQTIIETWFAAVTAQFARIGIELDREYDFSSSAGGTAAPKYLQLVHARRLWHHAFERCPDPYLGLEVGRALPLQAMNILAVIIMHSGTLREALGYVARYHPLISNSGSFHLRSHGDGGVALEYEVTDCVIPMHPAQMDSVFAGAVTFLSRCMPAMAGHYSIELPGTRRHLATGYAGFLGGTVQLGAARGRMHFSRDVIDIPWAGADGQLLASAREMADRRLRSLGYADGLIDQVKAFVGSTGFARASLAQVADALGMSRRSLQRRLVEANVTYRELVEAARLEHALGLLRSSHLPHYRIAEMVGYSEPSTLSHLVKRHLNKSPRQIRDELQRSDPD